MSVKRLTIDAAREGEPERLYRLCRKFVEDRDVTCPESIWQMDSVTEDVEVFIQEICRTIGYARRSKEAG